MATLDAYSGLIGAASPNGGTGYFRLEKYGNRWLMVSPTGTYLWMKAVQSTGPYDGGTVEVNNVNAKYPLGIQQWGDQANRRLTTWGFNTLGEYSSTYVIPDGNYGAAHGSTVPHPYIHLVKPSARSEDGRYPYNVRDVAQLMSGHYTGFRGHLSDVFDPAYATCVTDTVNEDSTTGGLNGSHYLIGTSSDDLDELFGFGNGPNAYDTSWRHPEIGYMVAITDPATYSKQAWVAYLQNKYGTIAALNTSWTSTYTSFTDVLNETGLVHSWIGNDDFALSNTSAGCKADMQAFTGVFADKYFSLVATAIRAKTPNHLVFGPDALGVACRPQIMAAAAKWCDAIQVTGWYANVNGMMQLAYTNMGTGLEKPLFAYMLTTSCADSAYALSCTQGSSNTNYATQALRATAASGFISSLYGFTTGTSVNPVIGYDMWEWTDKTEGGESAPFGLVTVKDNAYDGVEARIATGVDQWGFPVGGEAGNYGNFIGPVTTAHNTVDSNILALFSVSPPPPPPAPPTVSFTATATSITQGKSTTLQWTVQSATSAYITNIGTVAFSGSAVIFPTVTTSYTLTATGAGGTTQSSVTITVIQPKKHGHH